MIRCNPGSFLQGHSLFQLEVRRHAGRIYSDRDFPVMRDMKMPAAAHVIELAQSDHVGTPLLPPHAAALGRICFFICIALA